MSKFIHYFLKIIVFNFPILFRFDFYKQQSEIWNKIKFSSENVSRITAKKVFGLLVKDPRLMMPKKKSFNKISIQREKLVEYSSSKI